MDNYKKRQRQIQIDRLVRHFDTITDPKYSGTVIPKYRKVLMDDQFDYFMEGFLCATESETDTQPSQYTPKESPCKRCVDAIGQCPHPSFKCRTFHTHHRLEELHGFSKGFINLFKIQDEPNLTHQVRKELADTMIDFICDKLTIGLHYKYGDPKGA